MAINTLQKARVSGPRRAHDGQKTGSLLDMCRASIGRLPVFEKSKPLSSKNKIFLFSQLALMLETGTPLNVSLAAINTQVEEPFLKAIIEEISADVETGKALSEAMKKHEKQFSPVIISMIKAGESSGEIASMLAQAEYFERKKEEFSAMIKGATIYPMVLMVLCFMVIVFVLTFVFPKFSSLFEDIWDVLPVSTKILMTVSDLMVAYWYMFIAGALIIYALIWWVFQQDKVKLCMDSFKVSLPVVGKLFVMIYTARMLRILGFLLKGSVPLLEALEITQTIVTNTLYKRFIGNIIEACQEGKGIAHAFLQTEFLPETVKQVIKTGESSGKLDFVMIRLADYYDNEIEKQLKLCSVIIEPLALIVMGGVVAFIIMSIVLPIFKLTKAVHWWKALAASTIL